MSNLSASQGRAQLIAELRRQLPDVEPATIEAIAAIAADLLGGDGAAAEPGRSTADGALITFGPLSQAGDCSFGDVIAGNKLTIQITASAPSILPEAARGDVRAAMGRVIERLERSRDELAAIMAQAAPGLDEPQRPGERAE